MRRHSLATLLNQPPPRERSVAPALALAAILAVGVTCQGGADDTVTPGDPVHIVRFPPGRSFEIVLDPGHNPDEGDRGGRSVSGYWEVEFNDALARALGDELDRLRERVDLSGFGEAVVSYPTLVDFDGRVRPARSPAWRADRSFIGIDGADRLLLGSTEGGIFSLRRFGETLRALLGLDLRYALNLNGGPPPCLAIDTADFEYVAWGRYESDDSAGHEIIFWGEEEIEWKLPAVIALERRESGAGVDAGQSARER